jgi:hypothetical protein
MAARRLVDRRQRRFGAAVLPAKVVMLTMPTPSTTSHFTGQARCGRDFISTACRGPDGQS